MSENKPVIIYPLTVDWDHLHQRPQQLLKALARQGCVSIFCNLNFLGVRPWGHQKIEENLHLLNGGQLVQAMQYAKAYFPDRKVMVIFSHPDHFLAVEKCGADYVIFDSLDEPVNEFASWLTNYEKAVKSADFVLASSQSLFDRARKYRDDVALVPNGCEYDHFSRVQSLETKFNERMRIGFVGAIASWLDWELIRKISGLSIVEIVFVGALYGYGSPPLVAPNIRYEGHVPYDELPEVIATFDVCIIPFLVNDMTKGVSPIKFWEYLATGKPVVSTALPEVVKSGQATIIDHENFASAEFHNSAEHREKRIAFAKENSWDERANRILEVLKDAT